MQIKKGNRNVNFFKQQLALKNLIELEEREKDEEREQKCVMQIECIEINRKIIEQRHVSTTKSSMLHNFA